ncbi:H-NS family nucleoid-associated regulatory protein [Burkholderia cepacia]|uniref:H-NS histone family protein n=1 Tax=Burkholderia cepacia TaxID=292 RepID=UPI0009C07314|nr:H-NS histone family protein [Burkholderia cepacia]
MKKYSDLISEFERFKRDIDLVREYEAKLVAERVIALLHDSGIDVGKIFGVATGKLPGEGRAKIRPKYWNPATGATWSGRGKTPRWLIGQDLEKFRIQNWQSDDSKD